MDGIAVAGAIFTARWLAPNRLPGQTLPTPIPSTPVAVVAADDAPKRFLGSGRAPR
jgi:hypothetical protein